MTKTQTVDNADYDSVALKVGRRGPDKLLTSFSKTRFPLWVALSLCVHLGLAGFISYGYIRDNYIDPEGAAARQAAAVAAEKAAAPGAAPGITPAAKVLTTAKNPSSAKTPGAITNAPGDLSDKRKNASVMKRITEPAKPGEIPKQPGDLGISVEDTDLK